MENLILGEIHNTALISKKAKVGKNVTIGANTIIYDSVEIGPASFVGPNCILGEVSSNFYKKRNFRNPKLKIGKGSIIRSGTTIYAGTTIGDNFETGHNVTIRENTTIGKNCRVGTLSDIQGLCKIGNFFRAHSNVHISQHSKIGNYVWIFPYTVLTNDPHPPSEQLEGVVIEDFSVIATMVVILPGIRIGKNSLIGAHSLVRTNIAPGKVAVGNPAKEIGSTDLIVSKKTGKTVYPWPENFDRGMPWEGIGYKNWKKNNKTEI